MARRIAVKVLTDSDLTFFESQFRMRPNQRQKSINLDASVFIDQFYPTLGYAGRGRVTMEVDILGPGIDTTLRVTRKVVRSDGSKNWRLNGEFVRDPEDRFAPLREGDVAVMEFHGEGVPALLTLAVLARAVEEDSALVDEFRALVPAGRVSTVAVTASEVAAAIERAAPREDHPLHRLIVGASVEAALEDAALGGAEGSRLLRSRRISRTREQLAEARLAAGEIGAEGENLVHEWLLSLHGVDAVRWIATENAVHPWDLEVTQQGLTTRIEVKSTRGAHDSTFYVSAAEVQAALEGPPYHLVRVSELGDGRARVTTCTDFSALAASIVGSWVHLPAGVRPTTFALDPGCLFWGPFFSLNQEDLQES